MVGFMGAGKTVVGKCLAVVLGLKFVDLDDLIEAREGKKITEIFKENGEPYFRKVEKEIAKETAKKPGLVIACGGGVVLDKENITVLKENGVMIYLKAAAEVILKRTQKCDHRPLLNVDDPKKKIEELLTLRAPYYAQADFTVDTSNLSIEQAVAKVLEIMKNAE